MFKWLNERLAGTPYFKAAEALRVELEPLEKVQGAKPRLIDRLIRFVFTGEEENVVAELAAMPNTGHIRAQRSYYFHGAQSPRKGLPGLIKLLPEDPKIYLRLASVYDATYKTGTNVVSYGSIPIPALQGSLSWLGVFLLDLSRNAQERDPIFPCNLIPEMLLLANEGPGHTCEGCVLL